MNDKLIQALKPFAEAFEKYGKWHYADHEDKEKWFKFQDSNQVIPSRDLTMGDFRRAYEMLKSIESGTKNAPIWINLKDRRPEFKQWIVLYDVKFDEIEKTRFREDSLEGDDYFWIPFNLSEEHEPDALAEMTKQRDQWRDIAKYSQETVRECRCSIQEMSEEINRLRSELKEKGEKP